MGIELQVWRARIGLFGSPSNSGCSSKPSCHGLAISADAMRLSYFTLLALLVIGCVESNPGPDGPFKCLKCPANPAFATIGETVLHQKSHANEKNFKFQCPLPACGLQFLTYGALDSHVRYMHNELRNIPLVVTEPRLCDVAGCQKTFPSRKLLCQHLMKEHQQQEGIPVQCPFKEECKSDNYFQLGSFRTHLSQRHGGWKIASEELGVKQHGQTLQQRTSATQQSTAMTNNEPEPMEVDEYDIPRDVVMDCDVSDNDSHSQANAPTGNATENDLFQMKSSYYRSLAMFYLKLESEHFLPTSTVQYISEALAFLSEKSLTIVKEVLLKELETLEIPEDKRDRVITSVVSSDCFFSCHHSDIQGPSMTTNALRKSYYRSNFKYVKPKEINLSKDSNAPKNVYYVPIKKTLQMLLSDPAVEQEVVDSFSRESKDGVIEDYKDGSLFKARKQKANEKTIDLLIFQDAFTPTKDLSSVANVYQLLGMYMTIGNLRPHIRSKLNLIKLVMLIPDWKAIFAEFNLKCFAKVVKALKQLQVSGIDFLGEKVKVRLQFLIGDNKGQHEIGGFIQSFSSEFFCRFCPMSKTEILREPWRVGKLRTPQSVEEDSQSVADNRASYQGVSRPEFQCPFNELEDFHAADPSLAPCIGHDIFEGVINYDLSLIIQYFVRKGWISYEVLNRRIKKFHYTGQDSANKPAPLKYDKQEGKKKRKVSTEAKKKKASEPKLGGHAVQNWTLLRLIPFILDETIQDPDDEYWRLLLMLKEIVEYLCAPAITREQLSWLQNLIEDYSEQRSELLGPGKPKHHYLCHYPELMDIMGPSIHVMTLRFENFHQFFKRAARLSHNFINLGVTLIKKYCLFLAYQSSGSYFVKGVQILDPGLALPLKIQTCADEILKSALLSSSFGNEALTMEKIIVDEILFKTDQWLLMGNYDDVDIVVAKVKCMVLDGTIVFSVLDKYRATRLASFGIYSVMSESLGISCVPVQEMKYPTPISMYEWRDKPLCFALKHSLAFDAPSN